MSITPAKGSSNEAEIMAFPASNVVVRKPGEASNDSYLAKCVTYSRQVCQLHLRIFARDDQSFGTSTKASFCAFVYNRWTGPAKLKIHVCNIDVQPRPDLSIGSLYTFDSTLCLAENIVG